MSNTVTFNEQPTDFSAWMNDADMQDMHVNNVDETGRSLSELSIDELFVQLMSFVSEGHGRGLDDQMYYLGEIEQYHQYITFRVYDEKRAQNNV